MGERERMEPMARNPYSAPGAAVQDPPHRPEPRPAEVTRACGILWAVWVASFLTLHPAVSGEWWLVPEAEGPDAEAGVVFIVAMVALFAGAFAVLVWLTGRGHNWARWALLLYVIGTTTLGAVDFPRSLAETPAAAGIDAMLALAEAWALVLLFSKSAGPWFTVGNTL